MSTAPELPEEPKTDPTFLPPVVGRPRVVRGLAITLGVYAVAVLGFLWLRYWSSDDYQAARHYQRARELLGRDGGRTASTEHLTLAYSELCEAARLKPEVRTFHEQLESLNWRFDERKLQVPGDLRHRAEAVAMSYERIQQSDRPLLAVGARDRGWDVEALAEGPASAVPWAIAGGLLVTALFLYQRRTLRASSDADSEERVAEVEREVTELSKARRR